MTVLQDPLLHNQIIFESTNNIKTKKDQYKQIKKHLFLFLSLPHL